MAFVCKPNFRSNIRAFLKCGLPFFVLQISTGDMINFVQISTILVLLKTLKSERNSFVLLTVQKRPPF